MFQHDVQTKDFYSSKQPPPTNHLPPPSTQPPGPTSQNYNLKNGFNLNAVI